MDTRRNQVILKRKFITPFQQFAKIQGLGGYLLFGATIIAIIWANSPWGDVYQSIWEYKIGVAADNFSLKKPLLLWINDGLMAVFFFVIGLEIKRELIIGELNTGRKAALPLFAALGGMILPVTFFFLLNNNSDASSGWGVPMATDIAFSLAIITALGKRVPLVLKVFLTAFAIVDDIGAVIVIAIFYSEDIKLGLILISLAPIVILWIISTFKYYSKVLWLTLGAVVWILFLKAGIHPTIAGVILAFTVPIRRKINLKTYRSKLNSIVRRMDETLDEESLILSNRQIHEIDALEDWTGKVQSPLQHLEHTLHNWVAFFIIPIFALANAGVVFDVDLGVDWTIALIISVSLFAGKALGIPLFTYLGLKLRLTELPDGMNVKNIIGVGFLAGVGFTMSIFIANLAFTDSPLLLNSSKIGILLGSTLSGLTGYIILRIGSRKLE